MSGPTSFADFIGQPNAKTQIDTALYEALTLEQPLPNVLLTGPPGTGKTTFARLIAGEAGQSFDSIFWPPGTQNELARRLVNTDGVLLLDEIHRGGTKVQEWLYGAVNPNGQGIAQYNSGRKVPLENVTIIGATTDADAVAAPLRRRFLLELAFRPYDLVEMQQIVAGMLRRAGVEMHDSHVGQLAVACCGRPGMAERLVAAARGLSLQHGDVEPGDIFEHLELDEDGLEARHRQYLVTMKHIIDTSDKGVGLDMMAENMDLSKGAIHDIERLLQRLDLLFVGLGRGRELTDKGDKRVTEIKRKWGI